MMRTTTAIVVALAVARARGLRRRARLAGLAPAPPRRRRTTDGIEVELCDGETKTTVADKARPRRARTARRSPTS